MNLLLDTHIWIWSKLDPKRIGKRAAEELSARDNELWLSPISVWEALALMQKGRIRVQDPFAWVERAADQLREAPLGRQPCDNDVSLYCSVTAVPCCIMDTHFDVLVVGTGLAESITAA